MFETFFPKDHYLRQVLGAYNQTPLGQRAALHPILQNFKEAGFQCQGCAARLNGNSPSLKNSLLHTGVVLHTNDAGRTWHGCYDKGGDPLRWPHIYNA
jgi:hypothetical protein